MKKIIVFFLVITFLSSCVTSNIVMDVQRPADITIPQNIKDIVIVNRSSPSKKNLAGNIVEGIISGESVGYDRKGANYCVEGLVDMLINSERYNLKNTGGIELKGTGTANFPSPLKKDEIIDICSAYGADALLVLETFDSDSRVLVGDPVTRTKKVKGVKVKELRYPATLSMDIRSGWRIYESKNQTIVDENRFTEIKEFKAYGKSADAAVNSLPSKSFTIKQSGIFAGKKYGLRISPSWVKVKRLYFIGKHSDLKLAASYIKRNDWDNAISIWKNLLENPDVKIASRSAYNMAVATELQGRNDTAIEWARKSEKLGEKKSARYINVLHISKRNEEKLKQQLK